MMGRSHALSGVVTGLAVAPAAGISGTAETVQFALVSAGFALLPDLDCGSATVTNSLGSVSRAISWALRRSSATLYNATKGPRDENCAGTHRHLSHTALFAAAMGTLAGFGGQAHPLVVAAIILFGVYIGSIVLNEVMLVIAGAFAAVWFAGLHGDIAAIGPALSSMSWKVGIAVAVGCFTHCLGDSLTVAGCPFLFPLPIAGETWYEIRPPKPLRFHTGATFEMWIVTPVLVGLLAWLTVIRVFPLVLGGAAG